MENKGGDIVLPFFLTKQNEIMMDGRGQAKRETLTVIFPGVHVSPRRVGWGIRAHFLCAAFRPPGSGLPGRLPHPWCWPGMPSSGLCVPRAGGARHVIVKDAGLLCCGPCTGHPEGSTGCAWPHPHPGASQWGSSCPHVWRPPPHCFPAPSASPPTRVHLPHLPAVHSGMDTPVHTRDALSTCPFFFPLPLQGPSRKRKITVQYSEMIGVSVWWLPRCDWSFQEAQLPSDL